MILENLCTFYEFSLLLIRLVINSADNLLTFGVILHKEEVYDIYLYYDYPKAHLDTSKISFTLILKFHI